MTPCLVIQLECSGRAIDLKLPAGSHVVSTSNSFHATQDGKGFTRTRWTQVMLAEQDDSPAGREALEYLCKRYWSSIYTFLRQRGHRPHDAEDLTQGFLAKVLKKRSLGRADPTMGRFRTFLLRLLSDYLVDEKRIREALKRGGPRPLEDLSFDEAEEKYLAAPDPGLSPEEVFDRGWAANLLANAFQRLEAEYEASGQSERFRLLKPFLSEEAGDAACAELGNKLCITAKSASVTVYRFRTRYRHFIRDEVLATVADTELVSDEFLDLFGIGGS